MRESFPQTLVEAVRYFANPDNAFNFLVDLRWPNGVKCPRCQSEKVMPIATRKTWECKCCTEKKQFSVRVGSIFEDSPLSLDKWLVTIWLIANAKNGISSYEVHRAIGVTQKTAWFMLQRIRLALQVGTFEKMKGAVESDETYIGGLSKNMHVKRRKKAIKGTGGASKAIVHGLLERSAREGECSQVRASVVPDVANETIHPILENSIDPNSQLYTDTAAVYAWMKSGFDHQVIDHARGFVDGEIHTNGIENFWSLLKRTLRGTYVSVNPNHLFRYLDEQVFRFNYRKMTDAERFLRASLAIVGKRLTYQELTGKTA